MKILMSNQFRATLTRFAIVLPLIGLGGAALCVSRTIDDTHTLNAAPGFDMGAGNGAEFSAVKVQYDVDTNTGLCYAATVSGGGGNGTAETVSIANVPCTSRVLGGIQISRPDHLLTLRANHIQPVNWAR